MNWINELIGIENGADSSLFVASMSLIVALMSFFFTVVIGFASIRYTKTSLKQNKKTNKLTEDTLIEARKNYREQRDKLEEAEANNQDRNEKGMDIICGMFIDEVDNFIRKFLYVINVDNNPNYVSFNCEKRGDQYFFEIRNIDNEIADATNFWLIRTDIFYNYIFEASRIGGKCTYNLRSIHVIYNEAERLFHTFFYLTEDHRFKKYNKISELDFDAGLKKLQSDLLTIKESLELKKLSEY